MTKRVLVLGGYGNFGKRICQSLATLEGIELVIAGRSGQRAQLLRDELSVQSTASIDFAELDVNAPTLIPKLADVGPEVVIHTCGPFQGQQYQVAEACLEVGSHYLDLADDRRFVCDISRLDSRAKTREVLLVSGASTVPGLSSVVVDELRSSFHRVDEIDIAIAPGNKAERGEATVRGILSYLGHPFRRWEHGDWVEAFGWMDVRREGFHDPVGRRWLANVDVPDLELFPIRYAPVHTVRFQAGLELSVLHNAMLAMARLARMKVIKNWARYTETIFGLSKLFAAFGTDVGGMIVRLTGEDAQGVPRSVQWSLTAENGVGPYVPIISTILLAGKLIRGELADRGAMPCLGMYSLGEFGQLADRWNITQHVETMVG